MILNPQSFRQGQGNWEKKERRIVFGSYISYGETWEVFTSQKDYL